MNEFAQPNPTPYPVEDVNVALDMAYAEKPFLEVGLAAKENGLLDVADEMGERANRAGEAVFRTNQPEIDAEVEPVEQKLGIRYDSFSEAQTASKKYSDAFIDGALTDSLQVGDEKVGIKGFLDRVEMDESDRAVVSDPERVAGLYVSTSEMVARNLKIAVAPGVTPETTQQRRDIVKREKEAYLQRLADEIPQAAEQIKDWISADSKRGVRYPVDASEYKGFVVGGQDVLDAASTANGVRSNIKVQRQIGGTFIMGYSDSRVREKMANDDVSIDKRIYLNPTAEVTPEIFEKVLQAANEAGVSMQLKMFSRAAEMAMASSEKRLTGKEGGLRGDGVVVYVSDKDADQVLQMVEAIAKDNPDAFQGRRVSRVVQSVADGIGVGSQPKKSDESLTSSRAGMISEVVSSLKQLGLPAEAARAQFRKKVRERSIQEGINPDNLAFNAA